MLAAVHRVYRFPRASSRWLRLWAAVVGVALGDGASARADALTLQASPTIVEHVVIPGERLAQIAARYGVSPALVARDNGLDPARPRLVIGRSLSVRARRVPPERERVEYIVRFGDNWRSIAERHGVSQAMLRRWNRGVPRRFAAGQALTLYVDRGQGPVDVLGLGIDTDAEGLRLMPVAPGGQSVGEPTRGRLRAAVRLPDNPGVYTVRRPDFAWGSSHAVHHLQLALAKFRAQSGYTGELVVSDMSRRRGGAYAGHQSHQSGRDVDLWLPGRRAPGEDDEARLREQYDWGATWALVKALVRTGQVQYIFLSRGRQRHLYRAARAAGEDLRVLGEVIQYPRRAQTAIVRHAPKHTRHLHVRFRCAAAERRCR